MGCMQDDHRTEVNSTTSWSQGDCRPAIDSQPQEANSLSMKPRSDCAMQPCTPSPIRIPGNIIQSAQHVNPDEEEDSELPVTASLWRSGLIQAQTQQKQQAQQQASEAVAQMPEAQRTASFDSQFLGQVSTPLSMEEPPSSCEARSTQSEQEQQQQQIQTLRFNSMPLSRKEAPSSCEGRPTQALQQQQRQQKQTFQFRGKQGSGSMRADASLNLPSEDEQVAAACEDATACSLGASGNPGQSNTIDQHTMATRCENATADITADTDTLHHHLPQIETSLDGRETFTAASAMIPHSLSRMSSQSAQCAGNLERGDDSADGHSRHNSSLKSAAFSGPRQTSSMTRGSISRSMTSSNAERVDVQHAGRRNGLAVSNLLAQISSISTCSSETSTNAGPADQRHLGDTGKYGQKAAAAGTVGNQELHDAHPLRAGNPQQGNVTMKDGLLSVGVSNPSICTEASSMSDHRKANGEPHGEYSPSVPATSRTSGDIRSSACVDSVRRQDLAEGAEDSQHACDGSRRQSGNAPTAVAGAAADTTIEDLKALLSIISRQEDNPSNTTTTKKAAKPATSTCSGRGKEAMLGTSLDVGQLGDFANPSMRHLSTSSIGSACLTKTAQQSPDAQISMAVLTGSLSNTSSKPGDDLHGLLSEQERISFLREDTGPTTYTKAGDQAGSICNQQEVGMHALERSRQEMHARTAFHAAAGMQNVLEDENGREDLQQPSAPGMAPGLLAAKGDDETEGDTRHGSLHEIDLGVAAAERSADQSAPCKTGALRIHSTSAALGQQRSSGEASLLNPLAFAACCLACKSCVPDRKP